MFNLAKDLITEYWTKPAEDKEKDKNNKKINFFQTYCEKEPWQSECKEYDV